MGNIIVKKNQKGEQGNQQQDTQTVETSNSTQSNLSTQQMQAGNDIIDLQVKCSRCKISLASTDYFLKNCGQNQCIVKFHQKCFFKELNDQNTIKKALAYKCYCGTKIPSKIIRQCGAPNLMELLSSIHQRQLEQLLKMSYLRKNQEILSYCSVNQQKQYEQDYFLSKQDQLTYDETPQ